ncbi:transport permease protein [Virgisporangium aliadipatigenens]|uniref:Transport permease protein n=1 Tax=Virgisporangium aliadipatigenens TaxID=741659 RepID=A0A8J3YSI2_9ACTN|nr:ABC transporter permease [Virgisporangium aliadipatigenens]GIJ49026.1 transport permease protein [Virgisporangium aliadipatigenens]
MNTLAKFTWVEFKLLARDMISIPLTLVIPLGLVVAFGLPDSSRRPDPGLGGLTAIDSVLPTLALTVAVAVLAFTVLPTYLTMYRERRLLRRLATTPVKPSTVLGAQLLINIGLVLVSLGLVLVVGMSALGMHLPRSVPWFLVSMVLGLAAVFSISLLIASVAKTARGGSGWGFLLFFPSMFFAGVYLPKEAMPDVLARIGDFTPLGAFRQTVQDAWLGERPEWLMLGFLAAVAAGCAAAAAKLFRWE